MERANGRIEGLSLANGCAAGIFGLWWHACAVLVEAELLRVKELEREERQKREHGDALLLRRRV